MRCLRLMDLSNNRIEELPESLAELGGLEQLFLQHNQLERLPKLRQCAHLKEVMLGYNR